MSDKMDLEKARVIAKAVAHRQDGTSQALAVLEAFIAAMEHSLPAKHWPPRCAKGHSGYWRTLADTCMACDRNAAEAKAADLVSKLETARQAAGRAYEFMAMNHEHEFQVDIDRWSSSECGDECRDELEILDALAAVLEKPARLRSATASPAVPKEDGAAVFGPDGSGGATSASAAVAQEEL